jgi:hypothetical protein
VKANAQLGSKIELRPSVSRLGVQIICGDCSGDEDTPVKTHLDRIGRCDRCGGYSFILASGRAAYARRLVASRLAANEAVAKNGRVLSFEAGARNVERAGKIA